LQEPGYWTTCWFNLRSFDNWHGRLRYFVRMALRPGIPDFEAARLPRFLFPLYPFIRLLRLFGHLKPRAHTSTTSREAVQARARDPNSGRSLPRVSDVSRNGPKKY
jgi:hypothetical protein